MSFLKRLFGGATKPSRLPPANNKAAQWISNPWHAVSIAPSKQACEAARQAYRMRFLSKDAPQLPLPGCHARNCQCHYRHHDDRRSSPRRAADSSSPNKLWRGQERRSTAERRATDEA